MPVRILAVAKQSANARAQAWRATLGPVVSGRSRFPLARLASALSITARGRLLGHQDVDGVPDELLGGPPEQLLGAASEHQDLAPVVEDHHGVGRGVEEDATIPR